MAQLGFRQRCVSICENIRSVGNGPPGPRPGAWSGQPLSGWRFPGWLAAVSAPGSPGTGLPHVSALGSAVMDEPHPVLADEVQPETDRYSPRRHRGSSVHADNPWSNRCRGPHSCREAHNYSNGAKSTPAPTSGWPGQVAFGTCGGDVWGMADRQLPSGLTGVEVE